MVDSFILRIKSHVSDFDTLRSEFSKLCSLRILAYTDANYWKILDGHCLNYVRHYDKVYKSNPIWLEIRSNYIDESEVHRLYYNLDSKWVALNKSPFKSAMASEKKTKVVIKPRKVPVPANLGSTAKSKKTKMSKKSLTYDNGTRFVNKPRVGRRKRGNNMRKAPEALNMVIQAPTRLGTSGRAQFVQQTTATGGIIVKGTDILISDLSTDGSPVAGKVLSTVNAGTNNQANLDINPRDVNTFGTKLTNLANNYQYWKVHALKFDYEPTVGTNVNGSIGFAFDFDVLAPTPPATIAGQRIFSQYQNHREFSAWKNGALEIDASRRGNLQSHTSYQRLQTDIARSADQRAAYFGQLYCYNFGNLPPSFTLGTVWVDYVIEFSEQIFEPPLRGVGAQTSITLNSGATNGNTLQNGTGAVSLKDPAIVQAVLAPDGQPALFLAPGVYLCDLSGYLAGTTGSPVEFANSAIIPGLASTNEKPSISLLRADFSNPSAASSGTFAFAQQEVVTVPFGGAFYRPQYNTGTVTGATPSTITINLTSVAASLASFIAGLFTLSPSELDARAIRFAETKKRNDEINRRSLERNYQLKMEDCEIVKVRKPPGETRDY